jgi:hypothetical protein
MALKSQALASTTVVAVNVVLPEDVSPTFVNGTAVVVVAVCPDIRLFSKPCLILGICVTSILMRS